MLCDTVKDVAGTYSLAKMVVVQGGVESGDSEVEGEYVNLTLQKDGTTSGHFFVPPNPGEPGSGVDVDLTGTWTLSGNTATFDHDEETFIEVVTYTFNGGTRTVPSKTPIRRTRLASRSGRRNSTRRSSDGSVQHALRRIATSSHRLLAPELRR